MEVYGHIVRRCNQKCNQNPVELHKKEWSYRDGVLPYLQKRKARRQAEADAEKEAEEAEPDEERAGS